MAKSKVTYKGKCPKTNMDLYAIEYKNLHEGINTAMKFLKYAKEQKEKSRKAENSGLNEKNQRNHNNDSE